MNDFNEIHTFIETLTDTNPWLILLIIAIILCQVLISSKTWSLIAKLRKVLSGTFSTRGTSIQYFARNGEVRDEVTEEIEDSINEYLEKNKNAVSDFNIIKDIVERNCDSLEDEIASQNPLPLYLGLIGTVAGIVISFFTIDLRDIEKDINTLIGDVGFAMLASGAGIVMTTWALWSSKKCKATIEGNKNRFYSWAQANLLPVMSENAVSAITLLQQNLMRFNDSFAQTVDRLEEKLGDVGKLYDSQIEILDKIENIGVAKMATANVKILSALDGSVQSLDQFAQYMTSVTTYLHAVRKLNYKLDEHFERTGALADIADFYKAQMKEIEARQKVMSEVVVGVDDATKLALADLKQKSETGLQSLQETFLHQMEAMQKMINEQNQRLAAQMSQMPELYRRMEDIATIPSRLGDLLKGIEKSNRELAGQIASSNRELANKISQTLKSVPSDEKELLPLPPIPEDPAVEKPKEGKYYFTWILVLVIILLTSLLLVSCLPKQSRSYDSQPVEATDYLPEDSLWVDEQSKINP